MQCELYNDPRGDMFYKASMHIPQFDSMNDQDKFLHILSYQSFQSNLAYFLFKFYSRRKIFTWSDISTQYINF